jgi:hypothetical protein
MLPENQKVLERLDRHFPRSHVQHADDPNRTTLSPWPGLLSNLLSLLASNLLGSHELRKPFQGAYEAYSTVGMPYTEFADNCLRKHFRDLGTYHSTFLSPPRSDPAIIAFVKNEPQNLDPTMYTTPFLQNAYDEERAALESATTSQAIASHLESIYVILFSWQAAAYHELAHLLVRFVSSFPSFALPC